MENEEGMGACESSHYEITEKDLPLCCPLPTMRVWDAHPRVYLALEKNGTAVCPYCSTQYTLVQKRD